MESERVHYHGKGALLGEVFTLTHGYAAIPLFVFLALFFIRYAYFSFRAFFTSRPAVEATESGVKFHPCYPKLPDKIGFSAISDIKLCRYGQTDQAKSGEKYNGLIGLGGRLARKDAAKKLCLVITYRDDVGEEKEGLLQMQRFLGGGQELESV